VSGLNLTRLRVLIVDDNRLSRDMMKFALQALNTHTVAIADNGAAALRMLGEVQPDLVLLDWVMQPVDGLEVLKRLRADADNPLRFVPVVMVTAYSEVWRVQEARDAGANEFVVKPFSAHTLYSRIKNLVEHPRPFVEENDFFGPDRRRRTTAPHDDRRTPRDEEDNPFRQS
jgi:two-component system, chemotaxis family, chemotaxis protein CheY